MQQRFHFSTKPNRAHEVKWQTWGINIFRLAKEQDKPIFITIGNDWCQSCAQMDETSYSQSEIVGMLNQRFIPVRVDADQRPDIASRYNFGGWPTTAVLTPEGELISGGSYMAPEEMAEWLQLIDKGWREQRDKLLQLARQVDASEPAAQGTNVVHNPQGVTGYAVSKLQEAFDRRFAGFHHEPKLPMTEALELAMYLSVQGNAEMQDIYFRSIKAMYGSALHDPADGGFFRYSAKRDWTEPHCEKLLLDNARFLTCCLDAFRLTGDQDFKSIAVDIFRFMESELLQSETGLWSSSQAADQAYYQHDQQRRRTLPHPYVDRTVFINSNATVIRALLNATVVIDDPGWAGLGLHALDELMRAAYRPDRGMAHILDPETLQPVVWGLLLDQVAMGEALLSAYQFQADARYVDVSTALAEVVLRMQQAGGMLNDRLSDRDDRGALSRPYYDFQLNIQAARWLKRLAMLSFRTPDRYSAAAERIAAAWQEDYRRYGLLACNYALAVHELYHPWTVLTVVGDDDSVAARDLLQVGLHGYGVRSVSRLLDINKHAKQIELEGWRSDELPAAWLCQEGDCQGPMYSADELRTGLNRKL